MRELLPRILAEIFEQADVLKAGIALQIEDALGGEAEEMRDFFVGCIPKVTVMIRIFHQHFVRADGSHAIVNAVAAASGLPLDTIERTGMHDGACGPRISRGIRRRRDHLLRRRCFTKTAGAVEARHGFCRIIPGNHPRARDWILPQFHNFKTLNNKGEHCRVEESTHAAHHRELRAQGH